MNELKEKNALEKIGYKLDKIYEGYEFWYKYKHGRAVYSIIVTPEGMIDCYIPREHIKNLNEYCDIKEFYKC